MELSALTRPQARTLGQNWKQNAPDNAAPAVPAGRQSDLPTDLTGALPPVTGGDPASKNGGANAANAADGSCQTCKNRKYQDGSNDPGVSYQTPTKIDAGSAASAVRAHEMEHVTREQFNAFQEGRKVVSQSVTMHNAICPECGRVYVSGGTTRTVTKGQEAQLFQAGSPDRPEAGKQYSAVA